LIRGNLAYNAERSYESRISRRCRRSLPRRIGAGTALQEGALDDGCAERAAANSRQPWSVRERINRSSLALMPTASVVFSRKPWNVTAPSSRQGQSPTL